MSDWRQLFFMKMAAFKWAYYSSEHSELDRDSLKQRQQQHV